MSTYEPTPAIEHYESAKAPVSESIHQLFSHTLILGASVSADWNTLSPGKLLGFEHGGKESVLTVAQGGTPGAEMIRRLTPKKLEGRSVVIAMDFLFWDSTNSAAQPGIDALEKLLAMASAARVPIILGDIPELLPGRQVSRRPLNEAIASHCRLSGRCAILKLDEIHQQAKREGLLIEGRRYTMSELVPDGLHLSPPAARFLEERIIEAAQSVLLK